MEFLSEIGAISKLAPVSNARTIKTAGDLGGLVGNVSDRRSPGSNTAYETSKSEVGADCLCTRSSGRTLNTVSRM